MTVLPSPDNGEVGVSLMLPPKVPSFPLTHSQAELQFNLHCKMVTKLTNKTLSCKVGTSTVVETEVINQFTGKTASTPHSCKNKNKIKIFLIDFMTFVGLMLNFGRGLQSQNELLV